MECDPIKHRKICIDFDGVLSKYKGWKGKQHYGPPLPGIKGFLKKLVAVNIDFIVLTTRESQKEILNWFKKYKLPLPLKITSNKVKATAYIDDRAVYFDGNFNNLIKTLSKFKVYWDKERPFKALSKIK